jgi:hypothetical protein
MKIKETKILSCATKFFTLITPEVCKKIRRGCNYIMLKENDAEKVQVLQNKKNISLVFPRKFITIDFVDFTVEF